MTRSSALSNEISIYDAVPWMTIVIRIIQTIWTIARANTSLKHRCDRKNNRWHQFRSEFTLNSRWMISEIVLWTVCRDIVACLPFHDQKNAPLSSLLARKALRDSDLWGQQRKLNFHKYFWETKSGNEQNPLSSNCLRLMSRVLPEYFENFAVFPFSLKINFLPSCFFLFIFHLCLKMLAPLEYRLMTKEEEWGKGIFLENLERALKLLW